MHDCEWPLDEEVSVFLLHLHIRFLWRLLKVSLCSQRTACLSNLSCASNNYKESEVCVDLLWICCILKSVLSQCSCCSLCYDVRRSYGM